MQLSALLLIASVAVTGLLYLAGFQFFFLFLFIPLIPLVPRVTRWRSCPQCGWKTADSAIAFCPYDGTELIVPDREE